MVQGSGFESPKGLTVESNLLSELGSLFRVYRASFMAQVQRGLLRFLFRV